MRRFCKPILASAALCFAVAAAAPAEARVVVGVGIGVGVPFGYSPGYYPGYYPGYVAPYPYYPQRVIVAPPPAPAAPDPIFYPNTGQTTEQTEADRRECNRWAAAQPSAMADASVFQRATYACMEAHGYTVK